jgi:hypothetical protein
MVADPPGRRWQPPHRTDQIEHPDVPRQGLTDDEQILISAVRYCLGRRTYIVSECCRWLRARWSTLGNLATTIIFSDIHVAVLRKETGDPVDHEAWVQMLDWIRSNAGKDR